MKGLSKMKPAVRYIAIFVAVLLFALRPGAKAQPIVAHGYEFTFGTDSTRWIDIDGVGTFENRYSYPQTVQLPFDFTMYNRTFSTISVYYNGDVLFGSMLDQVSSDYVLFPYHRDVYAICGFGADGVCFSYGRWCSPPDSAGNRVFVLQFRMMNSPRNIIFSTDSLLWQVQMYEADNSVTLVYKKTDATIPQYIIGRTGLQFGYNRYVLVSPTHTPLYNTVWTSVQDYIAYIGWPGNNRYYRFVPTDTLCAPPAVEGVSSSWQTPGTVQLRWHACNRNMSYQVEYGPEGFVPGSGTTLATPDTSVTLSGLVAGQSYDAYVSADCSFTHSSSPVKVQFQPPCPPSQDNQIAFHDLYAAGVTCYTGYTSYPSWTVGIVDSGPLSACSRHTVHSNPLERDPWTGGRLYTIPDGHCVSVRLGNWRIGAEQESIAYTLHIDTNDFDLLVLRYALVEENPNHGLQNNPQFEFDITDLHGRRVGQCYHGLFVSGDLSGWQQGMDDVLWRDWEAVGVDLTPLHGQTIRVTLSNRDCAQTGHFGYGYFTLESAHKHFRSITCGEAEENTFRAPEGFSYRWYNANDTSTTLSTADSLHVNDTGSFCCHVTYQLSSQQCGFVMSTYMGPRYPVAAFSHESTDSCGTLVRFLNHSFIARDSSHTSRTSYPCEQYLWDFGDGTTSNEINPVHQFTADTLQTVTLYAMLADGACVDSVSDTFYFDLPRDTVFDTICAGRHYYFLGEDITRPGCYSFLDGCGSHVLFLHHWPRYELFVFDTIDVGETYSFNGMDFNCPAVNKWVYQTVNGCDSTVSLHLCSREERYLTVCENLLPYTWEGRTFVSAGSDTVHLVPKAGTDSIIILHLAVRPRPVCTLDAEPWCNDSVGYALPLSDTLCYTVYSFPHDSTLPPMPLQGGTAGDTLRLHPSTATVYRFKIDYCDTFSCPLEDSLLLQPIPIVEAQLTVTPSFLIEKERDITAIDLSRNATARQWFVNSLPLAADDSVLHYRAADESDSVCVVLAVNNDYCTDTAAVCIPIKVQNLWFPNVFTPDAPENNLFRGYGTNVKDYVLKIYTRWGDCIFSTKDINEGWDGTYLGVRSPVSAYLYVCNYTTLEGEPRTVSGTVTLLR